jgi:opacity protein-like surface antigen
MKKLLSIGLISAVLGTSAFASNIEYLGLSDKTLSVQAKHIDIKDSGLNTGWIYGINYIINKDLREQGAWGVRTGFEFNYGKLDFTDKSGNATYTEFSWLIGPSYTFNCGARAYVEAKVGYVGLSDEITSNSGTNGYVVAGVAGVEYPVMKHLIVGIEGEYGKTYIDTLDFDTTTFGGYIGYSF